MTHLGDEQMVSTARAAGWSARKGRDAVLPRWLKHEEINEAPQFDSVIVRGNGIGALTFSGRLARSESLGGRVVIASPPVRQSPKLIGGCTLRSRSLDYFSAAFAIPKKQILERLFGQRIEVATTRAQRFSIFRRAVDGSYGGLKYGEFMPRRRDGRALAYGVRNFQLVATLAELLEESGVQQFSELPGSFDACMALSQKTKTLVVNASHMPLEGAPGPASPMCSIVAYQTPMRRVAASTFPEATSLIAGIAQEPRRRRMDVGVFYPFVDPLTPAADSYGLFYRIIEPGEELDKEEVIEAMRQQVHGVGRAIGWEPVGEEEAGAGAQVPGFAWASAAPQQHGYLDLHRIVNAGLPIITGCGMARAGLGAWVAAEALLAGHDPEPVVNRSLRRWRQLNRTFSRGMRGVPFSIVPPLSLFPSTILRASADRPDMWAGVGLHEEKEIL